MACQAQMAWMALTELMAPPEPRVETRATMAREVCTPYRHYLITSGRDGAPGRDGEAGRPGQDASPINSTFIAHSAVEDDGKILISLNGTPPVLRFVFN